MAINWSASFDSSDKMRLTKLARSAQQGDTEAFLELIENIKGTLYRTARTILKDDEDCADALQETIIKAYQAISSLREPEHFRTWIYRILINECNTISRKKTRHSLPGTLPEPAVENLAYQDVELREAIDRLEEPLRLVVLLVYLEDMKIADAATVLGISEGAVKMRLQRSKTQLRAWLEPTWERRGNL
ncbi:RNA polymerase sigma-70 factor (ECF subfamily) [Paenibacillus cellulosilyticus]|uniref:RNA polymerase sigma-70 factor (ECF subfamily) n=1 Tax=Paenibacillus cellulosilyticus TaxID=375489 RepID=A0A2V2YTI4_9BACL|nr:sigma-70 family RNA polymerase sigma factor [Paenibacillus cellulosilyticus]PWW02798.1 RNA polymerase sigma-70 factor (ECF subfamily) [Paenibacillus cellulosilyticus]QKS45721.1 sigma-70 family RNA polymerase sigma factor [Paenibacillus cellulosilyticus]